MTKFRPNVLVALGANLDSDVGEPEKTLISAIKNMQSEGLPACAISRFFRTPSFPDGVGPDYVNAVIDVTTEIFPLKILEILHRIEHRFGRERVNRWGQRTLDLDLLAVGDSIMPDKAVFKRWLDLAPTDQASTAPDQLILPHPRIQDRAFVLVPMADIAPDWVHPVLNKSAAALCAQLPDAERAAVQAI